MAESSRGKPRSLFLPAASSYQQCGWCPPVDVYQTSTGWLLKFDLAGVTSHDVEVYTHGSSVTLRGTRRDVRLEESQRSYSMEITYDRFERSIELPEPIEGAQIATDCRDGMLLVRITTQAEER
jgi:HSP20 family protein